MTAPAPAAAAERISVPDAESPVAGRIDERGQLSATVAVNAALTAVRLAGRYQRPPFTGCGWLTPVINLLVAGPGNAAVVDLIPTT